MDGVAAKFNTSVRKMMLVKQCKKLYKNMKSASDLKEESGHEEAERWTNYRDLWDLALTEAVIDEMWE